MRDVGVGCDMRGGGHVGCDMWVWMGSTVGLLRRGAADNTQSVQTVCQKGVGVVGRDREEAEEATRVDDGEEVGEVGTAWADGCLMARGWPLQGARGVKAQQGRVAASDLAPPKTLPSPPLPCPPHPPPLTGLQAVTHLHTLSRMRPVLCSPLPVCLPQASSDPSRNPGSCSWAQGRTAGQEHTADRQEHTTVTSRVEGG